MESGLGIEIARHLNSTFVAFLMMMTTMFLGQCMHACSRPAGLSESELCHFPVIIIIMSRTCAAGLFRSGSVALGGHFVLKSFIFWKMHPAICFPAVEAT